ncbi:MAG TPA: glutathione peroxidase [Solimonas sp.]
MYRLLLCALLLLAGPAHAACQGSLLDVEAKRLVGPAESLCAYEGKVVLAVNTASHCGFTRQYEGLEALWREYKDRGLVILGFPSDQFGGQEFGDDAEIAKFCKLNFGVSFPMYTRSSVRGDDANPLFRRLIDTTGTTPKWNFYKYLIGRDGKTAEAFNSMVEPDSKKLRKAIEKALAAS